MHTNITAAHSRPSRRYHEVTPLQASLVCRLAGCLLSSCLRLAPAFAFPATGFPVSVVWIPAKAVCISLLFMCLWFCDGVALILSLFSYPSFSCFLLRMILSSHLWSVVFWNSSYSWNVFCSYVSAVCFLDSYSLACCFPLSHFSVVCLPSCPAISLHLAHS